MGSGSEELAEQVRKALRHLDDPIYLETLPLARKLTRNAETSDLTGGQLVRRTFRLAIAALEPSSMGDDSLVDASTYQVLYRYAILRHGMTGIAQELGMSVRSGYYALSRATEALARIVHDLLSPPEPAPVANAAEASSPSQHVREELRRLASGHPQDLEIVQLLREVLEDLAPLARQTGVELRLMAPPEELGVATKRVLLRQAIMNLLSWLIAASAGNCVTVCVDNSDQTVTIRADGVLAMQPENESPDAPHTMAKRISETLGLRWTESRENSHRMVSIEIPRSSRKRVLVVDDNEGVIALIRRYLHGQPYAVWGAHDGRAALALLDEIRPHVILLDIMLPSQDGWEVLGLIREACQAMGDDVPVVICSIINDPRLASALGAHAFLHKPITRASLLQALDTVTSSR